MNTHRMNSKLLETLRPDTISSQYKLAIAVDKDFLRIRHSIGKLVPFAVVLCNRHNRWLLTSPFDELNDATQSLIYTYVYE